MKITDIINVIVNFFNLLYNWTIVNVSWIKDIMWIVFTFIATVIAIKTYRNAKRTLFQPLNTEVIKEQKNLFINIYHILKDDLFCNIDYESVFELEFFGSLRELGYNNIVVSDEFENNYRDLVNSGLHLVNGCSQDEEISETEEILMYQYVSVVERPIVEGEPVVVFFMIMSPKCQKIINSLTEYANDPLLPTEMKDKLNSLIDSIQDNYTLKMLPLINRDINKIWLSGEITVEEIEKIKNNCYNEFVAEFDNHETNISEIYRFINEYLKVDEIFK